MGNLSAVYGDASRSARTDRLRDRVVRKRSGVGLLPGDRWIAGHRRRRRTCRRSCSRRSAAPRGGLASRRRPLRGTTATAVVGRLIAFGGRFASSESSSPRAACNPGRSEAATLAPGGLGHGRVRPTARGTASVVEAPPIDCPLGDRCVETHPLTRERTHRAGNQPDQGWLGQGWLGPPELSPSAPRVGSWYCRYPTESANPTTTRGADRSTAVGTTLMSPFDS